MELNLSVEQFCALNSVETGSIEQAEKFLTFSGEHHVE